jgi:hypothetical protein
MVICKFCSKNFKYQWEWRAGTYGAFQSCPHCRADTFVSSHNFWRVFQWHITMLIIAIEMILAPLLLYLLYPFRFHEVIDYPFQGIFIRIPTDFTYIAVFSIFVIVWILNLTPAVKYKQKIITAFKAAH